MTIRVDDAALILTIWTGGWVALVWGLGVIRAGRICSSWRALAAVTGIWLGALAAVVAVAAFVLTGRSV